MTWECVMEIRECEERDGKVGRSRRGGFFEQTESVNMLCRAYSK
jgi:hypothetical protein